MTLASTIASSLPLASLLICATLAAPSPQDSSRSKKVPLNPSKDSAIRSLETDIPVLMEQATVPGLSAAVVRNGQTDWLHGFGVINATSSQPITPDTVFEAASLSKPVFTYGVLKLVDQGKLSLDTPLTASLSKPYIEGDDRLAKITARIVLSHRTGFPNWRGDGNPLTIRFTPGERFSYSGEGFVYLQRAIEQITRKPLNDFMTEVVFQPLGMTSSSYIWRSDFDARAATGHDGDGQPREKRKPTEANAAASLHTTARDYALFLSAVLTGTGLNPATVGEMETPQVALDPACTNCTDRVPRKLSRNLFWGLGWGIERTDQGDSLWHWGDNGDFKCFVAVQLKDKTAIVMFTNSENGLAIAKPIVHDAIGGQPLAFTWIKYDSYDSVAMRFARAVRVKGASQALTDFAPLLRADAIPESSINSLGYGLLSRKQTADAIRIFQLNVDLYPHSANTYDSLGEAYMAVGDKAQAAKNYEKSLSLNPQNTNATAMLKKLREM
jgi:CubicO group peptidase (beta-lactamase class C family)